MSVEAMAIVLHHSKARGTAKLILVGIANHQGDGGAWPSIRTLARYANADDRTVQRAIKTLVGLGEVKVVDQGGGSAGMADHARPNLYEVRVECPPWCDRTSVHRDTRPFTGEMGLWKNPVTPVSPGDASVTGGVTPVSPGGVTPVSPEPYLEPDMNADAASADSTTDRASAEIRCRTCGYLRGECLRRAALHWDHDYEPIRRVG